MKAAEIASPTLTISEDDDVRQARPHHNHDARTKFKKIGLSNRIQHTEIHSERKFSYSIHINNKEAPESHRMRKNTFQKRVPVIVMVFHTHE